MSIMTDAAEAVTPIDAPGEGGQRATLARTVEQMVDQGACRIEICAGGGEPLIEIALNGPMPVNLVRRVLDAIDTIADATADELFVNSRPMLRRRYPGANNWVARARLRTRPSRLGP